MQIDLPEKIHQLAVTGTSNATIAETIHPDFADRSPAEQLLLAAGMRFAQHQAGYTLLQINAPAPAPATPDNRPFCSDAALQYFELCTSHKHYEFALPEFLSLMQQNNQQCPPEYIGKIHDNKSLTTDNHTAMPMKSFLGARGIWLTRHLPERSRLRVLIKNTETQSAPDDFERLRQGNPDAAREQLREAWQQQETPVSHDKFRHLAINLSADDEAFLLEAFQENNIPTIHNILLDVLAQLIAMHFENPDDAADLQLLPELERFVETFIHMENDKFRVQMPDEAQMTAYPLLQAIHTTLMQQVDNLTIAYNKPVSRILGLLPHIYYVQKFAMYLPELLDAATDTEPEDTLFGAWVRGVYRADDADSAVIFLQQIANYLYPEQNTQLIEVILQQEKLSAEAIHGIIQQTDSDDRTLFVTLWARACYATALPQACYDYLRFSIREDIETEPEMSKNLSQAQCRDLALAALQTTNELKLPLLEKLLEHCGTGWDDSFSQDFIAALQQIVRRDKQMPTKLNRILDRGAYNLPLDMKPKFLDLMSIPGGRGLIHNDKTRQQIESMPDTYHEIFQFRAGMHRAIHGTST